jgi:Arc/MetJ family transcription regulator
MRTTLNIDDAILGQAQFLSGVQEKTMLVREALLALIQRESAVRLALLGGSDPDASVAPRRQSKSSV